MESHNCLRSVTHKTDRHFYTTMADKKKISDRLRVLLYLLKLRDTSLQLAVNRTGFISLGDIFFFVSSYLTD